VSVTAFECFFFLIFYLQPSLGYTRPSETTQSRAARFRSSREERLAAERAREEQEEAAKRHAKEAEARKARLEFDREKGPCYRFH
jgi:hypothetical protein